MARQKTKTDTIRLQTDILSGISVDIPAGASNGYKEDSEELIASAEELIASTKPTPTLQTQVSDDGMKCIVPPTNRVVSPPPPRPKTPPKRPPSPPGTMVTGMDVDNIKVGEAAAIVYEVPKCVLSDASSMPEPGPQIYAPNDGTYITCTETMEFADVPYFPGDRERLKSRTKKYRTSSDTLKLQRLIQYLKSTGSETGTRLENNAKEYIDRVQKTDACKDPAFTIPHYTGNEDDWSSGGED